MKPFDHNKFIGYVCDVTPQYVRLQIPSAKLLRTFYFSGEIYSGGSVGSFVVIEGQEYGFLGRLFEINLPQGEKSRSVLCRCLHRHGAYHRAERG